MDQIRKTVVAGIRGFENRRLGASKKARGSRRQEQTAYSKEAARSSSPRATGSNKRAKKTFMRAPSTKEARKRIIPLRTRQKGAPQDSALL